MRIASVYLIGNSVRGMSDWNSARLASFRLRQAVGSGPHMWLSVVYSRLVMFWTSHSSRSLSPSRCRSRDGSSFVGAINCANSRHLEWFPTHSWNHELACDSLESCLVEIGSEVNLKVALLSR